MDQDALSSTTLLIWLSYSLCDSRLNTPPLGQAASLASGGTDPWDLDFLANATASKTNQVTVGFDTPPQENGRLIRDCPGTDHGLIFLF